METLAWIGFTQSLFGALLLLTKPNTRLPDRLLTVWMVICAITFIEIAIAKAESFTITPINAMITNVLLYFYSILLTKENFKFRSKHFYHALLPVVFILVIVWTGAKLRIDQYFYEDVFLPYRLVLTVSLIVSFFLYWFLSIRAIHRYRMQFKNEYSSIEAGIKLNWLLFVLIFYILYNLVLITAGFVEVFSAIETNYILFILIFNLFLVFAFTFYGLRQNALLPVAQNQLEQEAYSNSRLDDDEKTLIKQKLLQHFEKNEPYIDGSLTITSLANQLKVQRYKLTEVLNTELEMNFYRFVNEYRVEKVKKMLTDPAYERLSIEAVGYDCGFNSKSTFFTVFKNLVGMTPAKYQEKHKTRKL